MKKVSRKAFTLAEIMIAIAVIAILAAIAIPNMVAYRKTAHAKACKENMHLIESACRAQEIRTGSLETDLSKLVGTSGTGVLKEVPKCPVGGEYKIEVDPSTEVITVSCSKSDDDDHKVGE